MPFPQALRNHSRWAFMSWPFADWPEKGSLQGKQKLGKHLRDNDVHARILHALIGYPCHILDTGNADKQDPNCPLSRLLLSPHQIAVLWVSASPHNSLPSAPQGPGPAPVQ